MPNLESIVSVYYKHNNNMCMQKAIFKYNKKFEEVQYS